MTTEVKNIKDYLPFYLGCEIWSKNGLPYKLRPRDLDRSAFDEGLEKPILRPLSDMTEEEKTELYHLDDHALFELGDGTGYALPYVFTWCLSKNFDLFGLIESGLAIDKTTLK